MQNDLNIINILLYLQIGNSHHINLNIHTSKVNRKLFMFESADFLEVTNLLKCQFIHLIEIQKQTYIK